MQNCLLRPSRTKNRKHSGPGLGQLDGAQSRQVIGETWFFLFRRSWASDPNVAQMPTGTGTFREKTMKGKIICDIYHRLGEAFLISAQIF